MFSIKRENLLHSKRRLVIIWVSEYTNCHTSTNIESRSRRHVEVTTSETLETKIHNIVPEDRRLKWSEIAVIVKI